MESMLGALVGVVIFLIILAIGIYIAEAIFLNKFNKLVYGKGTPMAWIPVANIYLLGKLTFNKIVGWSLVVCIFLTTNYTITINGVKSTHTILPASLNSIVSTLYNLATVGLFIYAIIKYFKVKKEKANQSQEFNSNQIYNPNQQPMQDYSNQIQATVQPIQPQVINNPVAQPIEPTPIEGTQQQLDQSLNQEVQTNAVQQNNNEQI